MNISLSIGKEKITIFKSVNKHKNGFLVYNKYMKYNMIKSLIYLSILSFNFIKKIKNDFCFNYKL